jgi:hypothetical protein
MDKQGVSNFAGNTYTLVVESVYHVVGPFPRLKLDFSDDLWLFSDQSTCQHHSANRHHCALDIFHGCAWGKVLSNNYIGPGNASNRDSRLR